MALPESEEGVRVSFGVYKPTDGHDIDEAVAHLRALISAAERAAQLRALILKSVNGSWVSVFCISKIPMSDFAENRTGDDDVIRTVDRGSFHLITEEYKPDKNSVSAGDIVSVRRIYTDSTNQEVIAYSCLALLKSYFSQIEGLQSCAFYKSQDGTLVLGLSIWDDADSASAFLDSRRGSPGEPYWKDLGAMNLKYEVCQVVYTTNDKFIFNLNPKEEKT